MRVDKTQAYADWIDSLKDRAGRARILVRVERLIGGNSGQHRNLAGGDKSSQADDIELAIELARNFQE